MPPPHLKLCGVPLSQPFRSVAWALIQRRIPFEVQLCVPGRKDKIGTLHPDYIQKSRGRAATVPLIEVLERDEVSSSTSSSQKPFTIVESPAILTYLCQRFGWDDWYPTTITTSSQQDRHHHDNNLFQLKTNIDSYLHWHHYGTRRLALLPMPYIRPDIPRDEFDSERIRKDVDKALESLEHGWLSGADDDDDENYIAGPNVTIADLVAYEEVVQASLTGLLPEASNHTDFPNLSRWVTRMQKLPFHDEAHAALTTLGDLTNSDSNDDAPIMKRLSAATKAGLKNLKDAMPEDKLSSL